MGELTFNLANYNGLTSDSRNVKPGYVFVAISGHQVDGHKYIPQAVERGASLVVAQRQVNCPIPVRVVSDSRSFFYTCYTKFYNISDDDFVSVGITGTNGKTTISYLLEHMLLCCAKFALVCGTINYRVGDEVLGLANTTTPGLEQFLNLLKIAKEKRIRYLCMEVSSHALNQRRIGLFQFDVAIFSNLSQDHLDYHKDMESYFRAKKRLFLEHLKPSGVAIINVDDEWGRRLAQELANKVKLICVGKDADINVGEYYSGINGSEVLFKFMGKNYKMHLPLIGRHNVTNALLALGAMVGLGFDLEKLVSSLSSFPGVPGRLERVDIKRRQVFIDYAHTPDALYQVLLSLRDIGIFKRIISVFGCGGNRDKEKRPLMGMIADEFCDIVIITSDNPRNESPEEIINDILRGIKKISPLKHLVEPDRYRAICLALEIADPQDAVLIAGKGHEDYQIIGNKRYDFSDKKVVLEWAARYE